MLRPGSDDEFNPTCLTSYNQPRPAAWLHGLYRIPAENGYDISVLCTKPRFSLETMVINEL